MNQRIKQKNIRTFVILIIVVVFGVAAWMLVRSSNKVVVSDEVQTFVSGKHVPFTPLLPTHLPIKAKLQTDEKESYFNADSRVLTLRWVFPAETLPGQGTLLLYQTEKDSGFTVPMNVLGVAIVKGVSGSYGDILTEADIPASPGRMALRFVYNDKLCVLVSYAISKDELLKVAQSLQ